MEGHCNLEELYLFGKIAKKWMKVCRICGFVCRGELLIKQEKAEHEV